MQNSDKDTASKELIGIVFDIQKYSIHDGPGIRTTVFLKGCPLRCAWCQNPESQKKEPEILFNTELCTACGRCIEVCPVGANSRSDDGSIKYDRQLCIQCGKCVEVCPNSARRLSGKRLSVGEVVKEVLKDRAFYEASGGGVTLSGGEVTFQPEFATAILKQCKQLGLHTTIETCGYTSWTILERMLEYVDLVYYDIKHIHPANHKEGTGHQNEIILENARRCAQSKTITMKVRVPLIPDFNDSPEIIREIAGFVRTLPAHVEMDLLPYNPLGEGKFERIGGERAEHKEVQSDEYVEMLRAIVESELKKRKLHVVLQDH